MGKHILDYTKVQSNLTSELMMVWVDAQTQAIGMKEGRSIQDVQMTKWCDRIIRIYWNIWLFIQYHRNSDWADCWFLSLFILLIPHFCSVGSQPRTTSTSKSSYQEWRIHLPVPTSPLPTPYASHWPVFISSWETCLNNHLYFHISPANLIADWLSAYRPPRLWVSKKKSKAKLLRLL